MSLTLTPLTAIIIACLAGGALSVLAAAGTLALHSRWISPLVSFAVGALLGAVFLELLPHALEHGATERVMLTVLIGLLLFFLLEKLVLWRHSHLEAESLAEGASLIGVAAENATADARPHSHGFDSGRSGLMILIGNSVHNFCDGIVIAATFIADFTLGTTTALAIVAHAIPQQVGDFAVLLHSGYTRRRAFAYNLATGAATLVGGLAGYAALASMLSDTLRARSYGVWQVGSAADAEVALDEVRPDLILLDLMLPDRNGLIMCAKLKARAGAPVIICSATKRKEDAAIGFQLGADDFLRKPFSVDELQARIELTLRRGPTTGPAPPHASPDRPASTSSRPT